MPKYAVLGATGNCGLSLVRTLTTEHPDATVSAFVRSRRKLLGLLSPSPSSSTENNDDIEESMPNLSIHEGTLSTPSVLQACIASADAVFIAIAPPGNERGCSLVRETCEAVVAAVRAIAGSDAQESKQKSKVPLLVLLSSAEADDKFYYDTPWPVRALSFAANYFTYKDLLAAEAYLRREMEGADGLIRPVFFKPGGISHDKKTGHVLSEERSMTFVSWLDVAAGMVQVAQEGEERWAGRNVSVLSRKKARPEYGNAPLLLRGLGTYLWSFLPL